MFEQIHKTIQTMVDEGALTNPHNRPLEDLLEPHQIMNGDEVGFDPEGGTGRMECFTGRRKMQIPSGTECEVERRVVEEEAAVCPAPWQRSCRTARRQQYPTT